MGAVGTEEPRVRISTTYFFIHHIFTVTCPEKGAGNKVIDKTDSASDLMELSLAGDADINQSCRCMSVAVTCVTCNMKQ